MDRDQRQVGPTRNRGIATPVQIEVRHKESEELGVAHAGLANVISERCVAFVLLILEVVELIRDQGQRIVDQTAAADRAFDEAGLECADSIEA